MGHNVSFIHRPGLEFESIQTQVLRLVLQDGDDHQIGGNTVIN